MKLHPGWLAASLLLCVVLACNLSKTNTNTNSNTSTASNSAAPASGPGEFISEIRMSKDDGSGDPQDEAITVFSPSDRTIHCVVKLKGSDAGTKMKFSWWIIDAGGEKNERIKEIDYTTREMENVVHGHLSFPQDWPKGKYKVDVYVNGNVDRTIGYAIQ